MKFLNNENFPNYNNYTKLLMILHVLLYMCIYMYTVETPINGPPRRGHNRNNLSTKVTPQCPNYSEPLKSRHTLSRMELASKVSFV